MATIENGPVVIDSIPTGLVRNRLQELVGAVDERNIQVLKYLLEEIASVNIDLKDRRVQPLGGQYTIFGYAIVSKSDPEVLKVLLRSANLDVNHEEYIPGAGCFPLLCIAAYVRNFTAVELLCNSDKLDLHVTVPGKLKLTSLHVCVKSRDPQIVGHILQTAHERHDQKSFSFSGFLNGPDTEGLTSLHHAAWEGHDDIVAKLLKYEDIIDVNAKDSRGFTPLHFASWNNHLGVVNQLLAHPRIDPQVQSESKGILGTMGSSKDTPEFRSGPTIDRIIKNGEWHLRNGFGTHGGDTRVGYFPEAVCKVRLELRGRVATHLLQKFYPDRYNANVTALHCAAFAGHVEIVRALVGAVSGKVHAMQTLNAVDDHLMSPLHYAIVGGDASTVQELLSSPMVRGNPEEMELELTPLDMAAIIINRARDCKLIHKYREVKALVMERPDVQFYISTLYRDRQVLVDGTNAILVGAALIASITFAGWLQPPLGYETYYEPQFLLTGSAPPGTYETFAAVRQHFSVRVFWIFNNLSFFLAISTVLNGAGAVLPSQNASVKLEVEHIRSLLIKTSFMLSVSIFFVLGAFMAAGFACLPPIIKYQWGMIASSGFGCIICLIVLYYFHKRLYRLFRVEKVTGGFREKVTHFWHVIGDEDYAAVPFCIN